MKYEQHEIFLVWTPGGQVKRIYDSRHDALRFTNGVPDYIERRMVVPYSGRGRYRKPYVYKKVTKKRGKKNAR